MRFFAALAGLIFRRGTGILRFVFAVDDLIRLFAISIIIFLSLTILDVSRPVMIAGIAAGLVIDFHDIIDDIKEGKPIDFGFN